MNPIDANHPLSTSRLGQGLPPSEVQRGSQRSESTGEAGSQDLAAISSRGRFVATAMRAVQEASDTRADRIAELRAAIADGSYHSNARAIAERLFAGGTLTEA